MSPTMIPTTPPTIAPISGAWKNTPTPAPLADVAIVPVTQFRAVATSVSYVGPSGDWQDLD